MSNPKLPNTRLESIRELLQEALAEGSHADTAALTKALAELVTELDRTRPQWIPVAAGQHNYGDLYHVAGLPNEGQPPRWVGRGRYDAHSELWLDEDTHRPFRFAITHFFLTLDPAQLIGQPDGEEFTTGVEPMV